MDKDRQGTGTGTVDDTVVRLEREEQELLGELRRSLMLKIQPWIIRRWQDLARREVLRVNRVSLDALKRWAQFYVLVNGMVKRRAAKEQLMRKEARQQRSIDLRLLRDMTQVSAHGWSADERAVYLGKVLDAGKKLDLFTADECGHWRATK